MKHKWLVVDVTTCKPVEEAGKFNDMDDAHCWMWANGNEGQWITVREDMYERYWEVNHGRTM